MLAPRILELPVSAAASERNWSAYGAIHTKSRNRLLIGRAGKLVYLSENLKLLRPKTITRPRKRKQQTEESEEVHVLSDDSTDSTEERSDNKELYEEQVLNENIVILQSEDEGELENI